MGKAADSKSQHARAEQGGGDDDADLQRAQSEQRQVKGQQQADITIAKRTQRAP